MFLILAILIGLIPALIAQSKGRSFALWWLYGAAIFIIALPHALIMKPDDKAVDEAALKDGRRRCPYCAEMIRAEAVVCKHCGRDQPEPA